MMEFDILSRVQKIGDRKGATVYYARLKSQAKMDNDMVIERIVRETSLSEGDVKNALVSLSNVVCDALKMGMSVDLAELGNFRLNVSSKMMNSPEESATRADRALAMTRLFTLVRFSVSLDRPPKNSKVNLLRMTAWSPPRERAMSMDRLAKFISSWKESPSFPRAG